MLASLVALQALSPPDFGEGEDGGFLDVAWQFARDMLPAFVLLLIFIGVLLALSRALGRGSPADPSAGFRRQLILLAVTAVGGLFVLFALPLSDQRLSGVLTLIGLVVSAAIALAATTFVSNAMAGVMLRAVRNFKVGDFLQVGEYFGRVTERELFHTEIQTEDRDLLTLPNLYLVTNPVKVVRSTGTVLSAQVSLGYDVPRGRVEELLVAGAGKAGLDEPFVQVIELLDHAVVYRAAGLLRDVKQMLSTRSRLRAEMLDALHGAGVEIVSPAFVRQRVVPAAEESPAIPPTPLRSAPTSGANVEDVAFDKAKEAEDLAALRAEFTALEEELRNLGEVASEAGADDARREHLEERKTELARRIEAAQEQLDREHS